MILDRESIFKLAKLRIKANFFRILTKNNFKGFLKPSDAIAIKLQLEGKYEKNITNLINKYSKEGFSDFFFDVGANIGISSCQNGKSFKKIYCFEPNPLLFNILKTNLEIFLTKKSFKTFNYGLGHKNDDFDLYVPKYNWGGAYIKSDQNSYSDETLLKKDNFKEFNKKNYLKLKVKVKSAMEVFERKFKKLSQKGLKKGVCKIDVEGFEEVIINQISKVLPREVSLVIFFENWESNLDTDMIERVFASRKVSLKKIEQSIIGTSHSKIYKIFLFFLRFKNVVSLVPFDEAKSPKGDIVLEIT